MKKIVPLLLVISLYSSAQKGTFSIHAGAGLSGFRGHESLVAGRPGFSYQFGVSADIRLKRHLSLNLDLNYEFISQKNDNMIEVRTNFDDIPQSYAFVSTNSSAYVVLPVTLRYSFTDVGSFFINGGPFVGYLLKSRVKSDLDIPGLNPADDLTESYKKPDAGLSFGAGKKFAIGGKDRLSLEVRDNLGLVNTSGVKVIGNGAIRTNALHVILGWIIN